MLYDNSGFIHQILQISPELFRTRTTFALIMNSPLATAMKYFKYVNDTTINCSQAASSNVVEIYGIY